MQLVLVLGASFTTVFCVQMVLEFHLTKKL